MSQRKWGNRYKSGTLKNVLEELCEKDKRCNVVAQRIRDYFKSDTYLDRTDIGKN